MADKPKLSVFARTGPAEHEQSGDIGDLDSGHVRPIGIGLRDGFIAALDSIAAEHGISRGGLIRVALWLFVKDYRAGKVDMTPFIDQPEPPRNRVKFPK